MCTIAGTKVHLNYNCYNVYFNECLLPSPIDRFRDPNGVKCPNVGTRPSPPGDSGIDPVGIKYLNTGPRPKVS